MSLTPTPAVAIPATAGRSRPACTFPQTGDSHE